MLATNSILHSPWEPSSRPSGQEIFDLYKPPKVYWHILKILLLISILSQKNQVHIRVNIIPHLCIDLPSEFFPSFIPTDIFVLILPFFLPDYVAPS